MKNFLIVFFFLSLCSLQGWGVEREFHHHLICKDLGSDQILLQEGNILIRESPCSTFKIALSLIGYDVGILESETLPLWPYDEKYQALMDAHKAPHDPRLWMQNSCVWYSRALTKILGEEQLQRYVSLFQYGNGDISGDERKNNGLTHSWLSSSLKISPKEQISFLEKLLKEQIPVSSHAHEMTKKILFLEELSNGWQLYGKTGTGIRVSRYHKNRFQIGWFVGWAAKQEKIVLFAILVLEDDNKNLSAGLEAKKRIKELLLTGDGLK